jgi:membrane-associated protein
VTSDWGLVALGAALAFAESLLGVGILLPGELAITGTAAVVGGSSLPWLGLAVVLGATLGDQLNFWLGRRLGPRLAQSRLVRRVGRAHWDRGVDLVHRHGARAVLVSRLIPVVRTVVPGVAGVAGLSALPFAAASLAGSLLWASLWIGAGGLATDLVSWSLLPWLVAGVVLLFVGRRWTSRFRARRREAAPAPPTAPLVVADGP